MALRCDFQSVHGKCEPAVVLDDLKSAVTDMLDSLSPRHVACSFGLSGVCTEGGRVAGFVYSRGPAVWFPVCRAHLDAEEDTDDNIVLLPPRKRA